jgi:hypothetical protein
MLGQAVRHLIKHRTQLRVRRARVGHRARI